MTLAHKIITLYKLKGHKELVRVIIRRLFKQQQKSLPLIKKIVSNGRGIEIGGPSSIFQSSSILPIYATIRHLDNCNFQNNTLWNSNLQEGYSYQYHPSKANGRQFILDSVDLTPIQSESYDFMLSSHVIEHIANPIKALREWIRILKDDGHLILLVPDKNGTFDHKRPTTTLRHLIDDYENNIGEDDLTHLEEILEFHDLSRDPGAGSYENFKLRSMKNHQNRSLHHHVFDTLLVAELIDYMQLRIKFIESVYSTHIILVAQKTSATDSYQNDSLLKSLRTVYAEPPFSSEQL